MKHCRWHKKSVPDDDAVLVAAIERGSGAALPVYACTGCVTSLGILPLDEHPDDSDGNVRFRDPRFVGRRDSVPVLQSPR
jgi:hypothetical protein